MKCEVGYILMKTLVINVSASVLVGSRVVVQAMPSAACAPGLLQRTGGLPALALPANHARVEWSRSHGDVCRKFCIMYNSGAVYALLALQEADALSNSRFWQPLTGSVRVVSSWCDSWWSAT